MISGVRRASKSMKNLKKSSPECLGTFKNWLRWAGLAGLAAQVANVGPMGAHLWENGRPNGKFLGWGPTPTRQQLTEPGPRGGVGEGIILMYMRIGRHSTRPGAQGLGGLIPIRRLNYYRNRRRIRHQIRLRNRPIGSAIQ